MNNIIEKFIRWAENNGWNVKLQNETHQSLSGEIRRRYPSIPEDFEKFLDIIDISITSDETT